MAIIFTSPIQKRRQLFWGMVVFVVVLAITAFFIVFPLRLHVPSLSSTDSLKPLQVNMDILNSDKVKNLDNFSNTQPSLPEPGRDEPFIPY